MKELTLQESKAIISSISIIMDDYINRCIEKNDFFGNLVFRNMSSFNALYELHEHIPNIIYFAERIMKKISKNKRYSTDITLALFYVRDDAQLGHSYNFIKSALKDIVDMLKKLQYEIYLHSNLDIRYLQKRSSGDFIHDRDAMVFYEFIMQYITMNTVDTKIRSATRILPDHNNDAKNKLLSHVKDVFNSLCTKVTGFLRGHSMAYEVLSDNRELINKYGVFSVGSLESAVDARMAKLDNMSI